MTTTDQWHYRVDRAVSLKPAKKLPEGYLMAEGFAVVPGILRYQQADGSIVRELILAEDIHDPASLDSLRRKPVTWEHPPRDVTAANVAQFQIGDLDSRFIRGDDGELGVEIMIRRQECVEKFERGDKRGLSPGYVCRIDNTPGIHPQFGEYDRRQYDRRYNHLAIVANPRGGPRAAARYDGDEPILLEEESPMTEDAVKQAAKQAAEAALKARQDADLEQGRRDAEAAQKLADSFAPIVAALGIEKSDSASIVSAIEALKARQDAVPTEAQLLEYSTERAPLLNLAAEHKIDAAEVAKLGNAELRKRCAIAVLPTARQDATDDYYRGVLEVRPAAAPKASAIVQPATAPEAKKDAAKPEILSPREIILRQQAQAATKPTA